MFQGTLEKREDGRFEMIPDEYGDFFGTSIGVFKIHLADGASFNRPRISIEAARSFVGQNVLVRWKSGILQMVYVSKFTPSLNRYSLGEIQFRSLTSKVGPIQTKSVESIATAKIIRSVPKKPARPILRDF